MAKLFDISENYRALFDAFDDCDELTDDQIQAYFDTLDGIEGEFADKAENTACFIKELDADVKALDELAEEFAARARAKKNLIKRLKEMLLNNMQVCGIKKIDRPRAVISLRNNAESVTIEDERKLVKWLEKNAPEMLNYEDPEISRTRVKSALKDGIEIPGAQLVRRASVIIR